MGSEMCIRDRNRLGTDGLYCVTKSNKFFRTLVFSLRAVFLSENLISESVSFVTGCSGSLLLEGVV